MEIMRFPATFVHISLAKLGHKMRKMITTEYSVLTKMIK